MDQARPSPVRSKRRFTPRLRRPFAQTGASPTAETETLLDKEEAKVSAPVANDVENDAALQGQASVPSEAECKDSEILYEVEYDEDGRVGRVVYHGTERHGRSYATTVRHRFKRWAREYGSKLRVSETLALEAANLAMSIWLADKQSAKKRRHAQLGLYLLLSCIRLRLAANHRPLTVAQIASECGVDEHLLLSEYTRVKRHLNAAGSGYVEYGQDRNYLPIAVDCVVAEGILQDYGIENRGVLESTALSILTVTNKAHETQRPALNTAAALCIAAEYCGQHPPERLKVSKDIARALSSLHMASEIAQRRRSAQLLDTLAKIASSRRVLGTPEVTSANVLDHLHLALNENFDVLDATI